MVSGHQLKGVSREKAMRPLHKRREEGLQTAASQTGTQSDKDIDLRGGVQGTGQS